jgi:hypothetical protein
MSRSIVRSIRLQVRETAAEVAWAQWSALTAVAAPTEHHPRAMVDPEALVLLSVAFQEHERRLADLVYGLARAGTRLLSVQRMTAITDTYSGRAQDGLRQFAAAAAEAGDHRWHPHAERAADNAPPVRSKSIGTLRLNNGPSLVLRLRAGLGVGLKADVLALLLGLHGASAPLKVMALATGYTTRGLRKAAEEMAVAGFVQQSAETPAAFSADHRAWAEVLHLNRATRPAARAGVPAWRYWSLVFAFLTVVEEWACRAEEGKWSDYVASSRVRDLVQDHAPRLRVAGILLPDPREATGAAYLDDFAAAIDRLAAWCRKSL